MLHTTQGKNLPDFPVPVPGAQVTDADGRVALIALTHVSAQELIAVLRMADGHEIMVPVGVLASLPDGSYRLESRFALFDGADSAGNTEGADGA
jgi:hypothetical protein